MNAAPYVDPMQLADPRRFVQMQAALSSAEMFRKKANEWDEEHGIGYHLKTVVLIVGLLPFCWPLALYFADTRRNPYKGASNAHFMRYRETSKQLLAAAKATPAPIRPAPARKPRAAALAA